MPKSDMIVWTSKKRSPDQAARDLANEIKKMQGRGYELVSSNVTEAGRSKRSWVMLTGLNLLRGKQAQATATFRRISG